MRTLHVIYSVYVSGMEPIDHAKNMTELAKWLVSI